MGQVDNGLVVRSSHAASPGIILEHMRRARIPESSEAADTGWEARQAGTAFTRHQRPAPGACRAPLFQL